MELPTFLRHITLATRDPDRSAEFFRRTMGWKFIERPGNTKMETRWLEMGPGQELHLVEVVDFEISDYEQEFGRHFALSCPIGEFEALKARLVENGAKLIAPGRDTPFERFFFSSPEGYVFEIIEAEKFQDNIDQLFQEGGKE